MTNSHEKVWKEIWNGTKDLLRSVAAALIILSGCAIAIGFLLKMIS